MPQMCTTALYGVREEDFNFSCLSTTRVLHGFQRRFLIFPSMIPAVKKPSKSDPTKLNPNKLFV